MASLALDARDDRAVANAPISRHPAFPTLVATWFAALLGLGCLILPAVLLERVVGAIGLAAILPAVAPPLGMTARMLLALVAAALGAGLGLLVARQLARVHAAALDDEAGAPFGRRPVNAHEELGGGGFDTQGRRGLLADFVSETHAAAPVDEEPLELLDLADDYPNPAGEPDEPFDLQQGWIEHAPVLALVPAEPAQDIPNSPDWETAPLETLGTVQLVQRLSASLEKRRAWLVATQSPPVAPVDIAPARSPACEPPPVTAADADEALRRALATLQRMSSTA